MRCFAVVFFVFLFCFFPSNAQAHRPYLVKQATLQDRDGKIYILETWNGDGIFWVDPYKTQIRDQNGLVVARITSGYPFFCPSIEWCWSLGTYPVRFDVDAIRKKSEENDNKIAFNSDNIKSDKTNFSEYLKNPEQKIFRDSELGYPEHCKRSQKDGCPAFGTKIGALYLYPFLALLAFAIYIAHNPLVYLPAVASGIYYVLYKFICKKCFKKRTYKSITRKRIILIFCAILCFVLLIPLLLSCFLLPLIIVFYLQEFSPFLYILIIFFTIAILKVAKEYYCTKK